jgi:hypothetical protein
MLDCCVIFVLLSCRRVTATPRPLSCGWLPSGQSSGRATPRQQKLCWLRACRCVCACGGSFCAGCEFESGRGEGKEAGREAGRRSGTASSKRATRLRAASCGLIPLPLLLPTHPLVRHVQDCPESGMLWAEAIGMAPRPQRRAKATDATKRCDNDPLVVSSSSGSSDSMLAAAAAVSLFPALAWVLSTAMSCAAAESLLLLLRTALLLQPAAAQCGSQPVSDSHQQSLTLCLLSMPLCSLVCRLLPWRSCSGRTARSTRRAAGGCGQ